MALQSVPNFFHVLLRARPVSLGSRGPVCVVPLRAATMGCTHTSLTGDSTRVYTHIKLLKQAEDRQIDDQQDRGHEAERTNVHAILLDPRLRRTSTTGAGHRLRYREKETC